ncbi:hypothetical protein FGADI_4768 [Fusarium gaditjirri]|uniref:Uncharacterized protein n=1 Tax=Fusarium gaditjirri TaxID=282569 RepID=A0A8H4WZ94_9HYPO|nr:hypothetical protein FGADI_4768 [Fusarium gaditjirri]
MPKKLLPSWPKVKKTFQSMKSPFRKEDRVKDETTAAPMVDQHLQDGIREGSRDSEELGVDEKTLVQHQEQNTPASSDCESSTLLSDQESGGSSKSELYFDAQETILDSNDQVAVPDDGTEPVSNMITQRHQADIPDKEKEKETCQKFLQLSKRDTFKTFNLEFRDGPASYCISENGFQQRKAVRDILARKTLCQDCNTHRDSGKLQEAMQKLYELRYCHGCKASHPELFFSPQEKGKQHTQCLGRIGHLPLCSHVSFAGPDMVTLANVGGKDRWIDCDNSSHKLCPSFYEKSNAPSGFLSTSLALDPRPMKHKLMFILDTTLHLVAIDGCSDQHTKEAIRQLQDGSYTVNDTKALCKHFSSKILDECLASDSSKCSCFPRSERGLDECTLYDTVPNATCKICSAEYHLSLQQNNLKVKRQFFVKTFLDPSWLFNLNYNQDKECDSRLKRNPTFDERTKHVLWCDKSGCATGSERRWERMALLYLNDAFNKGELHDGNFGDDVRARDMAWLSLEYDIFNGLTA